ncbi:MAG: redoxin domain-containing protein [Acidobacteria bacterium]|nr:redoxin domain-containing protein [Acidobacteriota bacterium]
MRAFLLTAAVLFLLVPTFGQNESAPMQEKEVNYKNWTYKNLRTGENAELRSMIAGKKAVMLVYYAPFCLNWRHDAPILQSLYDKYGPQGLEIIAIGLYDPAAAMRRNLDQLKITFPAVIESESRADRTSSQHYIYRRSVGDNRSWGTPWYVLFSPNEAEKTGDVLLKKANIVNGEIILEEVENYIRGKLAIKTSGQAVSAREKEIEPCDEGKKVPELRKPC